jgi:hypothetical protein
VTVKVVVEGTVVGTKPEKKPPVARGTQGLPKEDCTTEWFCAQLVSCTCWGLGGGSLSQEADTYLRVEVEDDLVTNGRGDIVRAVDQAGALAHLDVDSSSLYSGCSQGSDAKDEIGEMHCEDGFLMIDPRRQI